MLVYAKSANCKLNQTFDYDSLQYSASLDYPLTIDGETYYAGSSQENYLRRKAGEHKRADWAWRWSKEKFDFSYANGFIVVKKTRNGTRIYTKTYQRATIDSTNGKYFVKYSERTAPVSSLALTANEFSNDNATKVLTSIFGEKIFDYSKPVALIEFILRLATDKNSIVLDSFAGSGTTAHAVINLNAQDGGNRKFILVELNDYAETITAERVKRVGGSFDYYELGAELFDEDGFINAEIPREKIFDYVYFAETHEHYKPTDEENFLGVHNATAYYFFDDEELNFDQLAKIRTRAAVYVIYAANCTLAESELDDFHITLKKIPRDVPRL